MRRASPRHLSGQDPELGRPSTGRVPPDVYPDATSDVSHTRPLPRRRPHRRGTGTAAPFCPVHEAHRKHRLLPCAAPHFPAFLLCGSCSGRSLPGAVAQSSPAFPVNPLLVVASPPTERRCRCPCRCGRWMSRCACRAGPGPLASISSWDGPTARAVHSKPRARRTPGRCCCTGPGGRSPDRPTAGMGRARTARRLRPRLGPGQNRTLGEGRALPLMSFGV